MLLEGKVAIVTGASRGIGKAIAQQFIAQGAKVAFTYRSSAEAAAALEQELSAGGGTVKGFQSDAASMTDAERLAGEVVEAFGTIDIVINNAGYFYGPREAVTPTDTMDYDEALKQIDICAIGPLRVSAAPKRPRARAKPPSCARNPTLATSARPSPPA